MPSLKRAFAAIENRFFDILVSGSLLTKQTKTVGSEYQPTVPTDWYSLKEIFKSLHFGLGDHILDVGCGTGRVMLFLARRYPHAKISGIELNSDVAKMASLRVPTRCAVIDGNVLKDCPSDVNVFYLFNPFHANVMKSFCDEVLNKKDAFTLVYLVPVYLNTILDNCAGRVNVEIFSVKSGIRSIDRSYAIIRKTIS